MLCIDSQTGNPYFNLAAEEYFLKETEDEFFILWESTPSVIVGKHQNTLSEINYRYLMDNGIVAARRLTGGGTVFHGSGNINFTFIRNGLPGELVNFPLFIDPVIKFLNSLGIDSQKGPKHEILVNGKKISGNAEHVYKNRVLHHGTLLFDADMEALHKSITHTGGSYSDRSVQSNRADVLNLSECLPGISKSEFHNMMYNYIRWFFNAIDHVPDIQIQNRINSLVQEKYSTWEWIYGWSPDYRFTNKWTNGTLNLNISLEVHRGIITACSITGSTFQADAVNKHITGERHCHTSINKGLRQSGIDAIAGKDYDDLVYAFF